MSEQQDVLADLGGAGVLAGIRWAYISATGRVLDDYSEAAGFDATWAGISRFTLFRDRLDRVFACGRYAVPARGDAAMSLDLLHAELTQRDITTMPHLPTDLVVTANLNGSPGWAWQDWQWLLASGAYGKIDVLPWPRKSPTKQRVAQQRNPEPAQPSLFDGLTDTESFEVPFAAELELDRQTLVVAHSHDIDHDSRELVLGRARLNNDGGKAWHWRQDLLSGGSAGGGRRFDDMPSPTGPDSVPDAAVRLRRKSSGQGNGRVSGEQ